MRMLTAAARCLQAPKRALAVLVVAVLLLGAACIGADPMWERNQAANDLFYAGDFEAALEQYQALLAERPDLDQLSYNAGNALHRMEAYDRAIAETQRALPPAEVALGVQTYFALGNHLLALNRLDEAYMAYRNALLLAPADADAKHNLELTLLLIDQRDNPEEPDEPPPGPSPDPNPGEGNGEPGEQPGEPPPGEEPSPGDQTGPGEQPPPPDPEEPPPGPGPDEEVPAEPEEPDGEPPPGEPSGPPGDAGEADPEALRRALEEALAGMDDVLTFEEAIRILDLLRQQREQPMPGSGPTHGRDY